MVPLTDEENKFYKKKATLYFHFIIKEVVKELEGQFECLGQNTKKHITFSLAMKK